MGKKKYKALLHRILAIEHLQDKAYYEIRATEKRLNDRIDATRANELAEMKKHFMADIERQKAAAREKMREIDKQNRVGIFNPPHPVGDWSPDILREIK